MMRLKPITSKELCRKLKKIGFVMLRQKGNYSFWQHPDGKCTVVPIHHGEDISKGLFKNILNNIELDIKKFEKI